MMAGKFQAVIRARHPKTLAVIASIAVYEHAERDMVENIIETGMYVFQPLIDAMRLTLPSPLISTELIMPDAAGIDIVDAAGDLAERLRRNSGLRTYLADGNLNVVGIIRAAWAYPPGGRL